MVFMKVVWMPKGAWEIFRELFKPYDGELFYPSLITTLCRATHVLMYTKALQPYSLGIISSSDLLRLIVVAHASAAPLVSNASAQSNFSFFSVWSIHKAIQANCGSWWTRSIPIPSIQLIFEPVAYTPIAPSTPTTTDLSEQSVRELLHVYLCYARTQDAIIQTVVQRNYPELASHWPTFPKELLCSTEYSTIGPINWHSELVAIPQPTNPSPRDVPNSTTHSS